MAKFEESRWADTAFSQNYRDKANMYLPFRNQFIEIAKLVYKYFFANKNETKVLDLGCGDGLFIDELLKSAMPLKVTLVDGSSEMLEAAKTRLAKQKNINFLRANFQELLDSDPLNERFDFIYSSLAIHHLQFSEKQKLYSYIFEHLSPGGYFLHYDVVLPPSAELEKLYFSLWREWLNGHPIKEERLKSLEIPNQYKSNSDNIPDTLDLQLQALKDVGFRNVDCIYKYGIFSLFGGSN